MAVMTEAEKVSELHQDVKNNLMNDDVEKVKNWQKEAYHKQMIGGFKEAKEAEEGFKKAQKPWAKKLKEVRAIRMKLLDLISWIIQYIYDNLCVWMYRWRQLRRRTTWLARRRSWLQPERPTARLRLLSHQTSRRNSTRKWTSANKIC